jgi:tripartite-type tricarboxylate transporter receptor subunit TctC
VAHAQTAFPTRDVHFVVAFAPGGIGDVIGRVVGQALSARWKQSVIIENRGGAGGNIGAGHVARSEPDGYTILVTTSAFSINLSLYDSPGYKLSDFQTVGVVASSPNIVVAAPGLKENSLPEIMRAAQTTDFSFGSAGVGTTNHLTGVHLFSVIGKLDVRHVPFTGAGPAVAATMAGHVPLSVVSLPAALEQVKAGNVKGIGVASAQRWPELPDVPTIKETGVADLETATMVAFLAPAKTPTHIVASRNASLVTLVRSGVLDQALKSAGAQGLLLDQRESQAYVEKEVTTWASVVQAAGSKVR